MADYSMVQECTDRYEVADLPDGGAEIRLRVPPRFRDLWVVKLSGLRASDAEIAAHEPDPHAGGAVAGDGSVS